MAMAECLILKPEMHARGGPRGPVVPPVSHDAAEILSKMLIPERCARAETSVQYLLDCAEIDGQCPNLELQTGAVLLDPGCGADHAKGQRCGLAVNVGAVDCHLVKPVWLTAAVAGDSIPVPAIAAGNRRHKAVPKVAALAVIDRDRHRAGRRRSELNGTNTRLDRHCGAADRNRMANHGARLDQLPRLGKLDQLGQTGIGIDLLLDAGELHQFRGELVGVHRTGGVLVLQLGHQQLQKGLVILGQTAQPRGGGRLRGTACLRGGIGGAEACRSHGGDGDGAGGQGRGGSDGHAGAPFLQIRR